MMGCSIKKASEILGFDPLWPYGESDFRNFILRVLQTYWQGEMKTLWWSVASKGWNAQAADESTSPHIWKEAVLVRVSLGLENLECSGSDQGSQTVLGRNKISFPQQSALFQKCRVSHRYNCSGKTTASWRFLGLEHLVNEPPSFHSYLDEN